MLLSVRGHPCGAVTTTKTGVKRSRQGRTRKPHAPPKRTECPAHGGERVSRTAKLPLTAKRPGYSEGTALYPCHFRPQDGKRQKRRSDATSLFLTGGMQPVGAASGKNIRAVNLPWQSLRPKITGSSDELLLPLIEKTQSTQSLRLPYIKQNDAFEPGAAPIKPPLTALRAEGTFRWLPDFAHPVACGLSPLKVLPAEQHVILDGVAARFFMPADKPGIHVSPHCFISLISVTQAHLILLLSIYVANVLLRDKDGRMRSYLSAELSAAQLKCSIKGDRVTHGFSLKMNKTQRLGGHTA